MPSVINTNLASLNTQRNLNTSQSSLNVSIQRLSSGLRVNSAKDDAAGLAIAERMNAQVRGLTVAARNANDGISLAQTAEGALGKIGDMVQRMRELAVQASNATNGTTDRDALQQEVTQLKAEIDRVAQSTSFNGLKLIDGSFTAASFQVGANAGESITVNSITNAQLAQLGSVTAANTQQATVGDQTLAIAAGDVKINNVDIGAIGTTGTAQQRQADLVDAINRVSNQSGVAAQYDPVSGKIQLSSSTDIVIAATANGVSAAGFGAGTTTATTTTGMTTLNVQSINTAQLAIQQCDAALTQVNSARANLGALQSRFESAVSNIQIASENATAARSRIMDTDYAAETANLSRAQILQQAGNAMLTQANQLPQQVLQLLKG